MSFHVFEMIRSKTAHQESNARFSFSSGHTQILTNKPNIRFHIFLDQWIDLDKQNYCFSSKNKDGWLNQYLNPFKKKIRNSRISKMICVSLMGSRFRQETNHIAYLVVVTFKFFENHVTNFKLIPKSKRDDAMRLALLLVCQIHSYEARSNNTKQKHKA